jgi:hypothetical protein
MRKKMNKNTTLKIYNIGLNYNKNELMKNLSQFGDIICLRFFCYNKKDRVYKNLDLLDDKLNYDCIYNCYVTYMNHKDAVNCMKNFKNYKLTWAKLEKNCNKVLYISNLDFDSLSLNNNIHNTQDFINTSLNINYNKKLLQLTHFKNYTDKTSYLDNLYNVFSKFGDLEYINLNCVENKNKTNNNDDKFYYLFVKYNNIYDSCKARYFNFDSLLGKNVVVKYKSLKNITHS